MLYERIYNKHHVMIQQTLRKVQVLHGFSCGPAVAGTERKDMKKRRYCGMMGT
jgi:hypothetical protein